MSSLTSSEMGLVILRGSQTLYYLIIEIFITLYKYYFHITNIMNRAEEGFLHIYFRINPNECKR